MEFFNTLETILQTATPTEKIALFEQFYDAYKLDQLTFNHNYQPIVFKTPSFTSICNIVDAKTMPKRTGLSTLKGKAYLVHNITHIEYSAIDLALDHCYRFTNMPKAYYDDWLVVAEDEIRHFLMLEKLLNDNGYVYGDFGVHSFLFDVSMKSLDLPTRMAAVPRYLEASGLDSNPKVIEKLSHIDDPFATGIKAALAVILAEEIDHVKKGDRWFKWACKRDGISPNNYYDIVEEVLPGAKKKKPYVNIEDRKRAGFTCSEIAVISDGECTE